MSWFEAILLGILQGTTEFLPVSSSGHLTLLQHLFDIQEPQTLFDLCLHLGTLVAVAWFFRSFLGRLLSDAFGWCAARIGHRQPTDAQSGAMRVVLLVTVATAVTGGMGVTLGHAFEEFCAHPHAVGGFLMVTGTMLLATHPALPWMRPATTPQPLTVMPWWKAVVIGVVQGLSASFRGISRSGSTITAGRVLNLTPDDAAHFSFLLFFPAIIGGTAIEMRHGWPAGEAAQPLQAMVGGVVAMFVGLLALRSLLGVLRKGSFFWFGPYCLVIGAVAILAL